jgi:hypothetical protein
MTEQRKKLIDKFQSWLDTDPRKQIIAAVCANIAEEYAEKQLTLTDVVVPNGTFCGDCNKLLVGICDNCTDKELNYGGN